MDHSIFGFTYAMTTSLEHLSLYIPSYSARIHIVLTDFISSSILHLNCNISRIRLFLRCIPPALVLTRLPLILEIDFASTEIALIATSNISHNICMINLSDTRSSLSISTLRVSAHDQPLWSSLAILLHHSHSLCLALDTSRIASQRLNVLPIGRVPTSSLLSY